MAKARINKPTLHAFCAKVRACYPNVVELGALLKEAGVDSDEARDTVLRYEAMIARLEPPADDAYERYYSAVAFVQDAELTYKRPCAAPLSGRKRLDAQFFFGRRSSCRHARRRVSPTLVFHAHKHGDVH